MKPIIETIIRNHRSDLFGAFGTDKPSEDTVIVKLVDELLSTPRDPVWKRPISDLNEWEIDALLFIAAHFHESGSEDASPITVSAMLVRYMREHGFLANASDDPRP